MVLHTTPSSVPLSLKTQCQYNQYQCHDQQNLCQNHQYQSFFNHFFFPLNWTMCIYVQPIAIWEGLQSPLYYQCFIFLEIIFHFPLRFGLNSRNLILCPNFPEDHRVWLIQYFSFIVLTMPIWLNWSDGRYEITCTRPLWGSLERNVDIWYLGWKS